GGGVRLRGPVQGDERNGEQRHQAGRPLVGGHEQDAERGVEAATDEPPGHDHRLEPGQRLAQRAPLRQPDDGGEGEVVDEAQGRERQHDGAHVSSRGAAPVAGHVVDEAANGGGHHPLGDVERGLDRTVAMQPANDRLGQAGEGDGDEAGEGEDHRSERGLEQVEGLDVVAVLEADDEVARRDQQAGQRRQRPPGRHVGPEHRRVGRRQAGEGQRQHGHELGDRSRHGGRCAAPAGCHCYSQAPYQLDPYQFEPYQFEPLGWPYQLEPYQLDPYQFEPYQLDPYQFEPYQFDPYQVTEFQGIV